MREEGLESAGVGGVGVLTKEDQGRSGIYLFTALR